MKFFDRRSIWVMGLIVGGAIAGILAPKYEMGFLVLPPVSGLLGAIVAQLAAYPPRGLVYGILVWVIGCVWFCFAVAGSVPTSIAVQGIIAVAAGGAASLALGYLTGRSMLAE